MHSCLEALYLSIIQFHTLWPFLHFSERKRNRDEASRRLGEWDKHNKKYWQESQTNENNEEMNVGDALSAAPCSQRSSIDICKLIWATLLISLMLIERVTDICNLFKGQAGLFA